MRIWIHQRMINVVIKKETRTITVRIIFGDEKTKAKDSFLVNALSEEYDSEPTYKKIALSKILHFFKEGFIADFYMQSWFHLRADLVLVVKLQIRMDNRSKKSCDNFLDIFGAKIQITYIEKFHKKVWRRLRVTFVFVKDCIQLAMSIQEKRAHNYGFLWVLKFVYQSFWLTYSFVFPYLALLVRLFAWSPAQNCDGENWMVEWDCQYPSWNDWQAAI